VKSGGCARSTRPVACSSRRRTITACPSVFRTGRSSRSALAAIQRVHKGSLSFSSGLPPKPQPGLPPTPELLALLQSAATGPADAADAGPRPVNEAVARSRAVIEAELTEYLGPMARVVVDEHVASAHDLTDFIDSLAGELNDPAKSAAFKLRVRERLASSVSGKNAR